MKYTNISKPTNYQSSSKMKRRILLVYNYFQRLKLKLETLQKRNSQAPDDLTGEFYQTFKN